MSWKTIQYNEYKDRNILWNIFKVILVIVVVCLIAWIIRSY